MFSVFGKGIKLNLIHNDVLTEKNFWLNLNQLIYAKSHRFRLNKFK